MAPMVSTIEIARPPEEVYAFATDPTRFTRWQRDVVEVRMLDGAHFATRRRFAGAERTTTQRITRDEPPYSWAAQGVDGPVRPHATITVEPVAGGSRVTFTLDFEGQGLGVSLLPLVRRQARRGAPVSHRNLKALLEGDR